MTDHQALSKRPLLLELDRVQRLYTGGRLLNRWQGLPEGEDSVNSEEFLASTVEYIGFGKPVEKGLSRTRLDDGTYVTVKQLIAEAPEAFLGSRYARLCQGHMGVLARAGDSGVRLVIQCHPTGEMARRYFHIPFGKTEAWVIMDTRTIGGIGPHLYCGFRPGVTRQKWKELFEKQDVEGMLACLYRFDVKQGDTILVPAGMPHAMGSGCLFAEFHEPCDYTIRPERNYLVKTLSNAEMHYGLGFETMLDFFDYTTYSEREIRRLCFPEPVIRRETEQATLTSLLRYENTPRFAIDRLSLRGEDRLPPFDGHYILVAQRGSFRLCWGDMSLTVPQGRCVFVPAGAEALRVLGEADILIAYPFRPTDDENKGASLLCNMYPH